MTAVDGHPLSQRVGQARPAYCEDMTEQPDDAEHRSEDAGEPGSWGVWSLAAALVSLVLLLVPMVGDVAALPFGIVAVLLGLVAVRRHDRGVADRAIRGTVGAALGAVVLAVVLTKLLVTGTLL